MNKILDNLQFKVFTDIIEKSEKNGKRRIRGYASTDALDRQGEVVSIEALRQAATHLLENPTVFYEHKHDQYPVGLCVASKIDDKGLLIDVEISQTADTLWTLIQEGILNRFSIGGRVTSAEEKVDEDKKPYNEITGIELFEVSVVGLPANPEARFEVVNKSFSMAIADEIKKREEDSEMEKEKEIKVEKTEIPKEEVKKETTVEKKEKPKVEEKKEGEPEAKKSKETPKDDKTTKEKPEEKKEVAQKKDLERYEKEDKEAAKKATGKKETTEKSQEAKPEEIVEKKTEKETAIEKKEVVEGEKVDEPKVEVKEEKCEECVVVEEKPAEEKVEEKPAESSEEKPEVKSDNSIVTDEEFEKLDVVDISKPYPNEHAARIRPVSDFQEGSFRSKQIAEGIRIIIGRLIGETTATVQSYRFHVDHFTAEEAKQWLKDHDITYILFEPATQEGNKQPEKKEVRVLTEERVFELFNQLKDSIDALGEKINAIEEKASKIEEVKPKVEENKEEPKVEKKTEGKVEEKPQRKSFIADAPYANDKKDEEKKEKDVKKPTEKGWTKIIYGNK